MLIDLKGDPTMTLSLSTLILLAVLGVLVALPSAFGASLLLDTDLDELGASGEGLLEQSEDTPIGPLSDLALQDLEGSGIPVEIWPFQRILQAPFPPPKPSAFPSPGRNLINEIAKKRYPNLFPNSVRPESQPILRQPILTPSLPEGSLGFTR